MLQKVLARARKITAKAKQDLLVMTKKCEDLSTKINRVREGSRLNLRDYITNKHKLVEERDAIAKAVSEVQ